MGLSAIAELLVSIIYLDTGGATGTNGMTTAIPRIKSSMAKLPYGRLDGLQQNCCTKLVQLV